MNDFKVEDLIETSSVDIINERIQETVKTIAIERERLLAFALHEGYDGVDIRMDTSLVTDYNDYSMGFNYEAWKGEPPRIDRWARDVQRYDFRVLDDEEKWLLLGRIGVDYHEG